MPLGPVAAIEGGCSVETPVLTLNLLCGSGLQAVISAAQSILHGDTVVAVAGGAESMSRAPYASLATRWSARMGNVTMIDMTPGALHDPFDNIHIGVTAQNVAAKFDISRARQDEAALERHRRVQQAIAQGRIREQIVPVPLVGHKGTVMFDTDERVRLDAKLEDMSKLKPAFKKDGGSVTAGNASGLNDAAAALVLMERAKAERRGLKPLARRVSYAHAGVVPKLMGIGPVPASRKALEKAGLKVADLDVVEAGLRGASLRGEPGAGTGPGEGEPERLRHLARRPNRHDRRAHHREGVIRVAAHPGSLRADDDLHRPRPGRRLRVRAHVRVARRTRKKTNSTHMKNKPKSRGWTAVTIRSFVRFPFRHASRHRAARVARVARCGPAATRRDLADPADRSGRANRSGCACAGRSAACGHR